jgi:hypothetical protein
MQRANRARQFKMGLVRSNFAVFPAYDDHNYYTISVQSQQSNIEERDLQGLRDGNGIRNQPPSPPTSPYDKARINNQARNLEKREKARLNDISA